MKTYYSAALAVLLALMTGCASKNKYGEERFLSEREQKTALAKTKTPQYFGFNAFPMSDGIGFSGTARLHPNHIATMKFQGKGIPVIKVEGRASRMKCNALIDTSSATTFMDFSTANEFEATFMGMGEDVIPYRGIQDKTVNSYAAVVSRLRVDQLFIENIPIYVRMSEGALGPIARGIFEPNPTLSIGYDLLSLFETIRINLQDNTIILTSTHAHKPSDSLLMSKARILSRKGYGLVVDGAIFGEPTPIVIDLAGDYYFIRSDKNVTETKQVSMGEVVYRKVPTMYLPVKDALPRVGRKMLEKYAITICPSQQTVFFEQYPPKK